MWAIINHNETKSILFYHLSGRYAKQYNITTGIPSQVAIKSLLFEKEKLSTDGIQMLIQPNGCISVEDYILALDEEERDSSTA